ncbi:MAG: hypothetical protein JWM76_518 [Pseudonocardiales bacterium]|nr:hypothetical protein [Pseudonocardiales bacterium]
MEYLILIHANENYAAPKPGTPAFDRMTAAWTAYNQKLVDGGHWIAGANLQPTATAKTVRKTFGDTLTFADGPYVDTKEQLGGFYLIEAADLDEALQLAGEIPIQLGYFEVRPVAL